MAVLGELNNGREVEGRVAGKGFMKKCQTKVKRWNRPWYWPHRAHNQLKWWQRDSRSLYSTPQNFTVTHSLIPSHQSSIKDPDHSYESPMGCEKAASRSRLLKATSFWQWNLIVYWCAFNCVCGKNLNFLSGVIRPVFTDPVTNGCWGSHSEQCFVDVCAFNPLAQSNCSFYLSFPDSKSMGILFGMLTVKEYMRLSTHLLHLFSSL